MECWHCRKNFSKEAIEAHLARNGATCPMCRGNLGAGFLKPNSGLAEACEQPNVVATGDGTNFVYTKPFSLIVTGSCGSGKSTWINLCADPSRQGPRVTQTGNGARGCTQDVRKVFEGALPHRGQDMQVAELDTPGFGDPEQDETEQLRLLAKATLELAAGIDGIVHVIRKGRMTPADRELPRLMLNGLATTAEEKRELCKRWIFVVTNVDSGEDEVLDGDIQEFRGFMKGQFPRELEEAVNRTIFVEQGRAFNDSKYGNAQANRDLVLDHVAKTRTVDHPVFRCKPVAEMECKALSAAMATWQGLGDHLKNMTSEEATSLYSHFKAVRDKKCGVAMTVATTSHNGLRSKWNGLPLITRDKVAVDMADRVMKELEGLASNHWNDMKRRMFADWRASGEREIEAKRRRLEEDAERQVEVERKKTEEAEKKCEQESEGGRRSFRWYVEEKEKRIEAEKRAEVAEKKDKESGSCSIQ